ncbi:MAG: hypothetical protein OWU32_02155 [Firmicutes bacterium]|nr:hypothetical protein [Bacillota bacterium]
MGRVFEAVGVSVILASTMMLGVVPAFAAKAPIAATQTYALPAYPLFDNLKVASAKWSYADEMQYVQSLRLGSTVDLVKPFRAPNGQVFFCGVISLAHRQRLFLVNRQTFTSLAKWRSYIQDASDFELIGHTLGVYTGPITVTVQGSGHKPGEKHPGTSALL